MIPPSDTDEGARLPPRPSLTALQRQFLSQATAYPEFPMPVCDRYWAITKWVPDVSRRELSDPMLDIYQNALHHKAGTPLFWTFDLARLCARWWECLRNNGYILAPTFVIMRDHHFMWQRQLWDRWEAKPERAIRKGGRIRKGRSDPPTSPTWIN